MIEMMFVNASAVQDRGGDATRTLGMNADDAERFGGTMMGASTRNGQSGAIKTAGRQGARIAIMQGRACTIWRTMTTHPSTEENA